MANIMTTYVKIVNLNEETFGKIKELFETESSDSAYVDVLKHINKVYGTEYTDYADLLIDWMNDNVGSKRLSIEFNDLEFSPQIDLTIESAWSVPAAYLEKLTSVLTEWDKEIALYGTYEDESYDPIGAFVYAHDYDDIEDFYDEIDVEQMWDDDDYREEIYDQLHAHRDSLYEGYLEVKKEREEEN